MESSDFYTDLIIPVNNMALRLFKHLAEMSARNLLRAIRKAGHKADSLTAICESNF
jgi:hypothetical protein